MAFLYPANLKPLVKINTSNTNAGSMADANAANSVLSHALPFAFKGYEIRHEAVGGEAQEYWECAWCQRNAALTLGAGLLITAILTVILGVYALAGILVSLAAAYIIAGKQNGTSELYSHAISIEASLIYDGIDEARAYQAFIDNLKGYEYSDFESKTVAELRQECETHFTYAKNWVAANAPLLKGFADKRDRDWAAASPQLIATATAEESDEEAAAASEYPELVGKKA